MNRVILVGNLTKTPELKQTTKGVPYCNFTVACNRRHKREDGTYESDFISCAAWRQTAEFIAKWFQRGQKIVLEGSLRTRSYNDDAGQKRYVTEVLVDNAEFAGGNGDKKNQARGAGGGPAAGDPFAGDYDTEFEPIPDSELPF